MFQGEWNRKQMHLLNNESLFTWSWLLPVIDLKYFVSYYNSFRTLLKISGNIMFVLHSFRNVTYHHSIGGLGFWEWLWLSRILTAQWLQSLLAVPSTVYFYTAVLQRQLCRHPQSGQLHPASLTELHTTKKPLWCIDQSKLFLLCIQTN